MDMSKDMMKKHFDYLVGDLAKKMEEFETLQSKICDPDYFTMSAEDASSLTVLFDEASADLNSQLRVFGRFMLNTRDHIKFE